MATPTTFWSFFPFLSIPHFLKLTTDRYIVKPVYKGANLALLYVFAAGHFKSFCNHSFGSTSKPNDRMHYSTSWLTSHLKPEAPLIVTHSQGIGPGVQLNIAVCRHAVEEEETSKSVETAPLNHLIRRPFEPQSMVLKREEMMLLGRCQLSSLCLSDLLSGAINTVRVNEPEPLCLRCCCCSALSLSSSLSVIFCS